MPRSVPLKALWLLLPAVLLGACASLDKNERLTSLDNTLKNYDRAIRWVQFDAAWAFHKWDEGERQAPPASLKNVRVTEYKVVATHMAVDNLSYTQTVHIAYYLLDSPRERRLTDRQRWEYDADAKRWWLVSEMPQF